jgi:hypothetical protein
MLRVYEKARDGAEDRLVGQISIDHDDTPEMAAGVDWYVQIMDARLSDAELCAVATEVARRAIPGLSLWGSMRITDAGLANLSTLSRLRTLDLAETQITDEGLVHLQNLVGLRGAARGSKTSRTFPVCARSA